MSTQKNLDIRSCVVGGAAVLATTLLWRKLRGSAAKSDDKEEKQTTEIPDWALKKPPPEVLGEFVGQWRQGQLPSDKAVAWVNLKMDDPIQSVYTCQFSWTQDEPRKELPEKNEFGIDAISEEILAERPFLLGLGWGPRMGKEAREAREWFAVAKARIPEGFQEVWVHEKDFEGVWLNWPGVEVSDPESVILYIHGGAAVFGSVEGTAPHAIEISKYCNKRLFSVRLGLAPEDPYPKAAHDVLAAYRWMVEKQGIPPHKICLTGFSSGATVCMLAAQLINDTPGVPNPACAVPVSAWHFWEEDRNGMNVHLWQIAIGNFDCDGNPTGRKNDIRDKQFSFLNGNYKDLCPIMAVVGSLESASFLKISCEIVRKCKAAGGVGVLELCPYALHCPACFFEVPETLLCLGRMNVFMEQMMERAAGKAR